MGTAELKKHYCSVVLFCSERSDASIYYRRLSLFLVVFAFAGFLWHDETEAYHFVTVTPGVLYRSGWVKSHGTNEMVKE